VSEPTPNPLLVVDLAAWLAGQAGLTVGTDIFAVSFPESGAIVSSVVPTGGPGRKYDLVGIFTVQVLTRGPAESAADVLGRAQKLYDAIYPPPDRVPVRNVALSTSWQAHSIDASQPPTDLGLSESGTRLVGFNVQLRAARKATV
jgi:hypothetical protein